MAVEYVRHIVDAEHIRNIGEQSVSNKIQAILELVKNAYDADASFCKIIFHGKNIDQSTIEINKILIVDDGIGLTKSDILNKWMKVGSTNKRTNKNSIKYNRRMSGEKGMGHYSAQRLGNHISMLTTPEPCSNREFSDVDDATFELQIDWTKYSPGKNFQDIQHTLETHDHRGAYGTTLTITALKDSWTVHGIDSDLNVLNKNLRQILLPHALQIDQRSKFNAELVTHGFESDIKPFENDFLSKANFKLDSILHNDKLNITVTAYADNISKVLFNGTIDSTATCGDGNLSVWWFYDYSAKVDRRSFFGRDVNKLIKKTYGIKIYNDNIRIMPYGEPGNDWLKLDERKAQADSGGKVRNPRLIGHVLLSRSKNPDIIETTTRQALKENESFISLKNDFIIPSIHKLEIEAGKFINTQIPPPEKKNYTNEAVQALTDMQSSIESKNIDPASVKSISSKIKSVKTTMKKFELDYSNNIKKYQNNAEVYMNLATVGIQTLAFNHEILDPLIKTKGNLGDIIRLNDSLSDEEKLSLLKVSYDFSISSLHWARYIQEFSSSLSEIADLKKKNSILPIESICSLRTRMSSILDKLLIDMLDPTTSSQIPTLKMNKTSFESIFINLITNSVRALRKVPRKRKIIIKISKTSSHVLFHFEDNGFGIKPGNEGFIFDPLFTTYNNVKDRGTGMGLPLIRSLLEDIGGTIDLEKTIFEELHPNEGMTSFIIKIPYGGDNHE